MPIPIISNPASLFLYFFFRKKLTNKIPLLHHEFIFK